MFAAKAKAYLAMKFLGPTLNWTFKNSLPAKDQDLLDQNTRGISDAEKLSNESSCNEHYDSHVERVRSNAYDG
jgi:hypothetical protein